jgi:hypothetical protein
MLAFAASTAIAVAPDAPAFDGLVAPNAGATRVDFEAAAGGNERWLAFMASADTRLAIDVLGSSYADACSVRMEVLDGRDRVVGRQSCAANVGRVVALEISSPGLYRLHLVGRVGNAGSMRVGLRSERWLDA